MISAKYNVIKVLHYVSKMNRGGEETFIMNVFHSIDKTKVSFDFLCTEEGEGDYDSEIDSLGGHVKHIKLNRLKGKLKQVDNFFLLYKYLRELNNEYKVFHIHTQHAMDAFLDALAAKIAGFDKVVIHSHSTNTLWHLSAHKFFRFFLRFLNVDKFACSDLAGEWLFGTHDFQVIGNGVDLQKFCFNQELRKNIRKLNHWDGKIIVGHIGSFTYAKNHSFIIEIFQKFNKICPESVLVLIGSGKLKSAIEEKANMLGLKDYIIFMGNRTDVETLYLGMDLFLFPSIYEGLPVVLVEAQSCDLPCLISDSITKQVDVNNTLYRMAIDEQASTWAEKMYDMYINRKDRHNISEILRSAGFDMITIAAELQNYYCG